MFNDLLLNYPLYTVVIKYHFVYTPNMAYYNLLGFRVFMSNKFKQRKHISNQLTRFSKIINYFTYTF